MGTLLNKAAIFGKQDIQTRDVEVPEWGGTVRVKAMNGIERDQFEAGIMSMRKGQAHLDLSNARARLVALTVIDEDGNRMFGDDDIAMLGMKSAAALDRISDVASALSGLGDGDLEELLGNSSATTSAGSPTA